MQIRITVACRFTVFSPLEPIFHYLELSLIDHYLRSSLHHDHHMFLVHILHHLLEGDKALLILHLPQHVQLVQLLI